jgi:aspartyl-tRNA(Asn)/glutamyl-tRNA(Gln) amidotransferase subunit A
MYADEVAYLSATDLAAAIRRKHVSPVEAVDAVLARIERVNPRINAYCTVTADAAREAARRGVRTSFDSRIYEHNVPDEDAPVVERLRAAGAILVGKTTTPEFGWKGTTDSPLTGISRNPWDPTKTPGGSSGGAAAAVAAGLAPLAVGTDGGGSIRIPGSFCGVFGFKPTCGVVPVYPVSATGTLSHVGPLTRTVRDAGPGYPPRSRARSVRAGCPWYPQIVRSH